jgi:beta-glucosidase-like glycosyl hydrolase/CubicO group peptidase (beta-lactamase class C family)
MKKTLLLCCITILFLWLGGCTSQPPIVKKEKPAGTQLTREAWVESTLTRLTLEEKVGQMILCRAYGYYYSAESDEFHRLEREVKVHKFGGFVFFQGDIYETAMMINRLQEMSDVPLLIASDFEWGSAMRIRRGTRFPEAMAIGASRDTALAFETGKAIGEEARAMGIEQDYAPVADVNVNPDNPVINTRSFGENPAVVAGMASAFARGLKDGGVIATAKHFPGHGDTQVDSHVDLPLIPFTRARLDSVELVPFRRLVSEGIGSIMIAHLVVPALETTPSLPSTLSPSIIHGFLQGELGYKGLIVTDAMDMGAVVNKYGSDSSAVRALQAGADVIIILPDEDAAVPALVNAVKTGRITEERINYSVRKILGIKFDMGLASERTADLNNIANVIATPAHLQLAKRVAREAVTLVKNNGVLPLERFGTKRIVNLIISDANDYRTEINRNGNQWPNEPVGDYFLLQMKKRYSKMETIRLDPSSNALDFEDALKKLDAADIIVTPIYSKARSGSGRFGLPLDLANFLGKVSALKKPQVVISLGSPYVIKAVDSASAYVCAYSDAEIMTEAVCELMFGEIPAAGKLPVSIPGMFPYGTGASLAQSMLRSDQPEADGFSRESLAMVDSVVVHAIRNAAFPGAQVLIAKDGGIVYNKAFGTLEYTAGSPKVNKETMFDLASVTKVIATTSALMKLYDEGKLALDDKVTKYIPEFGSNGKENITIRNLLVHNGGLPAFKQLYRTVKTPAELLDSVYRTELIYKPGDSTIYSDFDFIVLGKIIETITSEPLNEYVRKSFFSPLKLDRTMFTPPHDLWSNIAPTEYDSVLRKSIVRGTVHDENAYAIGGVSGHAGLFSDASDLAVVMQMLLNGGSYAGRQYIKPATIKLFTAKQDSRSTRALGWDTKTVNGYSTAGSLFSGQSFGHTGFTGTSVWADPARNLFVIFLTNRVNPTRANDKIKAVRPALHDAVIKAIKSDE